MLLKRHYDPAALKSWKKKQAAAIKNKIAALVEQGISESAATKTLREQYADEHGLPKISHVEVKRAGKAWRPSKKVVEQGAADGWMSIADGKITIKTGPDDPDVNFKIVERRAHDYDCVREKARG